MQSVVTDVVYLSKEESVAADGDFDNDAEYDDEYDDTYDDNAVGQEEPDAADSDRGGGGRAFVLPRVLGGGHVRSAPKGPSIKDVTHKRGEGVVQNVTIVLIGCVNGTVTRGSKNVKYFRDVIYGRSLTGYRVAQR